MNQKKKVLHIISSLNIGGTQVLLRDLLKTTSFSNYQHYFLVEESSGFLDNEIIKLGGEIIRVKKIKKTTFIYYIYNLIRIIKIKKIDIVHSHVSYFSGINIFISFLYNVKIRISHAHSMSKKNNKYTSLMRLLINKFSTQKIACSHETGISIFGSKTDFIIIKNGIFLNKRNIKQENNISPLIIGHIARLVPEKNQKFLIDLISKKNNSELHIIGDGPLKNELIEYSQKIGVSDRVYFHGVSRYPFKDIGKYKCNVMIYPSIREGFGISIIESQYYGFPTIISNNVPKEAIVIPSLVKTISLENSDIDIDTFLTKKKKISQTIIDEYFINKECDIKYTANKIGSIYESK
ncbi:glycosyltransferase [Proteus mirabilis]|uniref:glycosyltransferase n=2 Tax=Proteus mirabilis TaxID=584 RepID=UPI0007DC1E71|nr:glycosyltransferase [Proteus mirabilis]SSL79464.1 group 1 glycosyl transferase [Klebsiella pneumoniae]MCL8612161.1 glycosyltransferase [Proteus mirabilis]MDC5886050.1 glycosyltransferase [Proteus mirabilis]MDC5903647.1 glycosyltransferase [Proteus mirabilis]MDC5907196.1 glycosyltransferase [Proteus mirabilis]